MRFGIHLPNSGALTAEADLVGLARAAEKLGFATVWVFDHLFNPVELSAATRRTRTDYYNRADMPYYDALTTLAVVAGATTTIGLGTRVLLPVLRPPVALAKQIGTLAALAGPGRLTVGVGAGWLIEEFDAVGIDPAERFARLDEHVAVMRAAWTDGISEHSGSYYAHPPAGFHPTPPTPVPVLVGGGTAGALRRVAEWGDGWALPNLDPGPNAATELRDLLDRLARACSVADRDVDELRLVVGAPLAAPLDHFELLAGSGIDEVDLMLTNADELTLESAAEFVATVGADLG